MRCSVHQKKKTKRLAGCLLHHSLGRGVKVALLAHLQHDDDGRIYSKKKMGRNKHWGLGETHREESARSHLLREPEAAVCDSSIHAPPFFPCPSSRRGERTHLVSSVLLAFPRPSLETGGRDSSLTGQDRRTGCHRRMLLPDRQAPRRIFKRNEDSNKTLGDIGIETE